MGSLSSLDIHRRVNVNLVLYGTEHTKITIFQEVWKMERAATDQEKELGCGDKVPTNKGGWHEDMGVVNLAPVKSFDQNRVVLGVKTNHAFRITGRK